MRCLYLSANEQLSLVEEPKLGSTTERHKMDLLRRPYPGEGAPLAALAADASLDGIIFEMHRGYPGRDRLQMAGRALRMGKRAWLYYPNEAAVECLNRERLGSYWRHWLFIVSAFKGRDLSARYQKARRTLASLPGKARRYVIDRGRQAKYRDADPETVEAKIRDFGLRLKQLDEYIDDATPVPFPLRDIGPDRKIPGVGVYLRTDFWAKIESGGSYGHTCYVAKELANVTEQFVCFMAHRYKLLDDYGLRQVVMPPPGPTANESDIVTATEHYEKVLRAAFEALRPAYIYERVCLGNYVGALLSRELGIPYIVEYNGSEISMRRSFDGKGYVYEYEYLKAEEFAFTHATMISVISTEVRDSLIARGIDKHKILVNPNGADLEAYAPAVGDEKAAIRAEAGLDASKPVVGFTGTFGGWHGIDVLAAAIPQIAARVPQAQFLLIGDGNYKFQVDQAVAAHGLEARVVRTGRVPQVQGARLLKACDLYVSPHSSHMVDSKFFGSPTKIFEYMAMGGAIVASDLEQIGQILSPALRADDLQNPSVQVGDARSVLCEPGNVEDFVEAVSGLLERQDLWPALGANARQAVDQHYSWRRHVARLWPFLAGERENTGVGDLRHKVRSSAPARRKTGAQAPVIKEPGLATGDRYKDEVQKQWDNDPAGSHYVKNAEPHTLEWLKEVEAYRYGEYAPWMLEVMEFDKHAGETLLEIGGGIGTDHAQFAQHGAITTDLDLSSGHLALAQENFKLRGLQGTFVHHDAEKLPFDDNTFDVVYSNGVIHHTPNTYDVVREIRRVLRPGGKAIIMVYAENSLHYWRNLAWAIGIKEEALLTQSMGEIMSRSVERSDNAAARPLVKVYTKRGLKDLFAGFEDISIVKRQMVAAEKPRVLQWVPLRTLEQLMGWNLIIKARKPRS